MIYCQYYQARIHKQRSGFLVSVLRSFEHLVFDRTLDKETQLFEFFVPEGNEPQFLELMQFFVKEGIVLHLEKQSNRLSDAQAVV
jgi:hypothetical protein